MYHSDFQKSCLMSIKVLLLCCFPKNIPEKVLSEGLYKELPEIRKCCGARSQVQAGNPSARTNPFIRTCTATLVLSHNLICPYTLFSVFVFETF